MFKMKKLITTALVAVMIFSINTVAFASEPLTQEYDLPRYETENLIEGVDYEVGEGFNVYLDTSSLNYQNSESGVQPFHTQKWIVDNIVNEGSWVDFDSKLGKVLSGAPGVTLDKTYKRYWSATTNLSAGISKSVVSAELGFSLTWGIEATSGGSFHVPTYHNGKKVERVELISYKLWEKHTFDVSLDSTHFDNPVYYGNYHANKPYGIHFEPVYYYE